MHSFCVVDSCVLASASPLLRRMLVGKRAPYSIYIDGISGHIWQFALHFLYVGEMCALNEFEALAVAAAGEKLGIDAMVMAAKQYFAYTDNHGIVDRDNISSSPTQNRVFSRADRNELPGKRRLDGAIGLSQYSESQGKKCRVGHFSGDNVGSVNNSASTENGNRDETPLEIQTVTKKSSSDLHHKIYSLGLTSSSDGLSEVVKLVRRQSAVHKTKLADGDSLMLTRPAHGQSQLKSTTRQNCSPSERKASFNHSSPVKHQRTHSGSVVIPRQKNTKWRNWLPRMRSKCHARRRTLGNMRRLPGKRISSRSTMPTNSESQASSKRQCAVFGSKTSVLQKRRRKFSRMPLAQLRRMSSINKCNNSSINVGNHTSVYNISSRTKMCQRQSSLLFKDASSLFSLKGCCSNKVQFKERRKKVKKQQPTCAKHGSPHPEVTYAKSIGCWNSVRCRSPVSQSSGTHTGPAQPSTSPKPRARYTHFGYHYYRCRPWNYEQPQSVYNPLCKQNASPCPNKCSRTTRQTKPAGTQPPAYATRSRSTSAKRQRTMPCKTIRSTSETCHVYGKHSVQCPPKSSHGFLGWDSNCNFTNPSHSQTVPQCGAKPNTKQICCCELCHYVHPCPSTAKKWVPKRQKCSLPKRKCSPCRKPSPCRKRSPPRKRSPSSKRSASQQILHVSCQKITEVKRVETCPWPFTAPCMTSGRRRPSQAKAVEASSTVACPSTTNFANKSCKMISRDAEFLFCCNVPPSIRPHTNTPVSSSVSSSARVPSPTCIPYSLACRCVPLNEWGPSSESSPPTYLSQIESSPQCSGFIHDANYTWCCRGETGLPYYTKRANWLTACSCQPSWCYPHRCYPTRQQNRMYTCYSQPSMTESSQSSEYNWEMGIKDSQEITHYPSATSASKKSFPPVTIISSDSSTYGSTKPLETPAAGLTLKPEAGLTPKPTAGLTPKPAPRMTAKPAARLTTKPAAGLTTLAAARSTTKSVAGLTTKPAAGWTTKPAAQSSRSVGVNTQPAVAHARVGPSDSESTSDECAAFQPRLLNRRNAVVPGSVGDMLAETMDEESDFELDDESDDKSDNESDDERDDESDKESDQESVKEITCDKESTCEEEDDDDDHNEVATDQPDCEAPAPNPSTRVNAANTPPGQKTITRAHIRWQAGLRDVIAQRNHMYKTIQARWHDLAESVKKETDGRSYTCSTCGTVLHARQSYYKHVVEAHLNNPDHD